MLKAPMACFVFGMCYFYLLDAPAAAGSAQAGRGQRLPCGTQLHSNTPHARQRRARLTLPIPLFRNHLLLILRPKGGDSPRRHFYVGACRREKLW